MSHGLKHKKSNPFRAADLSHTQVSSGGWPKLQGGPLGSLMFSFEILIRWPRWQHVRKVDLMCISGTCLVLGVWKQSIVMMLAEKSQHISSYLHPTIKPIWVKMLSHTLKDSSISSLVEPSQAEDLFQHAWELMTPMLSEMRALAAGQERKHASRSKPLWQEIDYLRGSVLLASSSRRGFHGAGLLMSSA